MLLLSKLVSFVLQHVPIYETHFEFDLIDYFDSKLHEKLQIIKH